MMRSKKSINHKTFEVSKTQTDYQLLLTILKRYKFKEGEWGDKSVTYIEEKDKEHKYINFPEDSLNIAFTKSGRFIGFSNYHE